MVSTSRKVVKKTVARKTVKKSKPTTRKVAPKQKKWVYLFEEVKAVEKYTGSWRACAASSAAKARAWQI